MTTAGSRVADDVSNIVTVSGSSQVPSYTGYALALWNVRWANGLLFVLFVCAFVPFQIIMYPLIVMAGPGVPIPGTPWKAGLGVPGFPDCFPTLPWP